MNSLDDANQQIQASHALSQTNQLIDQVQSQLNQQSQQGQSQTGQQSQQGMQ
jgi:hypothetical protein